MISDLNQVRLFAKIAEMKSVTGAARSLGKPKSTVSRDLARLEASLGVTLMQRSNRKLTLTDSGRLFLQHAKRILGDLADAEAAVGRLNAVPRGLLRVSAPFTSGHALLAPLLPGFLERYPQVQVLLELENRRVDIIGEDFDVAIRVGRLEDSSLTARKLGHAVFGLFASPAYLARMGHPENLTDLARHDIVDKGGLPGPKSWKVDGPGGAVEVDVAPRLSVNDPAALRIALLGGAGIGWLPSFLAAHDVDNGHLIRLFPHHHRDKADIHALFRARRSLALNVKVFVDYLVEHFLV
ncbi:LysR family transcriptional regulator [Rhizobium sp. AG207R]|uniref:LysR family transcriptional regulator n=1 Tax=Rhizobium sp. AG207R TaxID=2802287 RepID=UPI0013B00A68|nr:LysR family transcriptional regulator [Rhizobium sp. AG207R]MCZ3378174.1 LysR family transcriptional regulator [Rhizobium sp. AG207R]